MKPGPASATVITLTSTPERLVAFRAAWEAIGAPLPLNVHCSEPDTDPIRGCHAAHRDVLTASNQPVVVFEDDAVFAPGFTLDLAWPDDAELFYLGGQHMRRPQPVAPGIVRAFRVRRTHGYVSWDPQRLRRWLKGSGHVDGYLNLVTPLCRYAAAPFTVGQRGGVTSTLRGTARPADLFWN